MNVSIITVNYNGKAYLKNFLESCFKLDYPRKKYEVLVVDNGSKDGSVKYVNNNFPKVRVLRSEVNLGFGGGNNLGIANASGDLFFLVNNDTCLREDTLRNVTNCFQKNSIRKNIGAVNCKVVLYDKYLPLKLVGSFLTDYNLDVDLKPTNGKTYSHSYGKGADHYQEVFLPINFVHNDKVKIKIQVKSIGVKKFSIALFSPREEGKTHTLYEGFYGNESSKWLNIEIKNSQFKKYKVDLIQNAGNVLFRDGYGRDRGACVIGHAQFYEADTGQYEIFEEIHSFCGAAVLINKKATDQVGVFDTNFFMYYEDNDLALRMKKNGWKIFYCPKSMVRHIHSASSKEFSPFFVYNTERNRLLMVFKHWPRIQAIHEWLKYLVNNTLGYSFYILFRGGYTKDYKKIFTRLKINLSLIRPFVWSMVAGRKLSKKEVRQFF